MSRKLYRAFSDILWIKAIKVPKIQHFISMHVYLCFRLITFVVSTKMEKSLIMHFSSITNLNDRYLRNKQKNIDSADHRRPVCILWK